jgi:hypothetical protein
MTTVTFDTHAFIKKLTEAGFTDEQAEVLIDTVRAAQGVDLSNHATKTDLLELENRLVKWDIGIDLEQIAVISALIKLL